MEAAEHHYADVEPLARKYQSKVEEQKAIAKANYGSTDTVSTYKWAMSILSLLQQFVSDLDSLPDSDDYCDAYDCCWRGVN